MTVENSHLSELNLSQGNGTKLKSNLSVKSVNTEKSVNFVSLTRLRLIKIVLQNKDRPNLFQQSRQFCNHFSGLMIVIMIENKLDL